MHLNVNGVSSSSVVFSDTTARDNDIQTLTPYSRVNDNQNATTAQQIYYRGILLTTVATITYLALLTFDKNFDFRWSCCISSIWAGISIATWQCSKTHITRLALAILLTIACDVTSKISDDKILNISFTMANLGISGPLVLWRPFILCITPNH